jgi:hypothetical protein
MSFLAIDFMEHQELSLSALIGSHVLHTAYLAY